MFDLPLIHYGPLGQTYHHLLEKLEHHIEYILDRFLISFSEEPGHQYRKNVNRMTPFLDKANISIDFIYPNEVNYLIWSIT